MQPRMVSSLSSFRSLPLASFAQVSENTFIDDLCNITRDLPTMKAAVEQKPVLAYIPILPVWEDDNSLGSYGSEDGVEINMVRRQNESLSQHFMTQMATLPHEMRHGFQDLGGCLRLNDETWRRHHIEDLILCNRIAEADATAFSLTVMYEYFLAKDDIEPLSDAAKIHPGSVAAYWRTISRDENAHWNGKAAQAAFTAYFHSDNRSRLRGYDTRLCREYLYKAVEEKEDLPMEPPLPRSRSKLVSDYMSALAGMPFVSKKGNLCERKAYRPDYRENFMSHLSQDAKHYIYEVSRMLALD